MRFVIVNVLPPPLFQLVEALRLPLNEAAGTHEALRYPPHVTLRTGLVCADEEAEAVAERFFEHARRLSPVAVEANEVFTSHYQVAGKPRVMFGWEVQPSAELLSLHLGLLEFREHQKGPQGPYQPHISLAYHDLTPAGYEQIEARIRRGGLEFPRLAWTVDHAALFYEKDAGWKEYGRAVFHRQG